MCGWGIAWERRPGRFSARQRLSPWWQRIRCGPWIVGVLPPWRSGRLIAILLCAVWLAGCASRSAPDLRAAYPVPASVSDAEVTATYQRCADEGYQAAKGLHVATWTTTVLGLVLWPLLVVPIGTAIAAGVKERGARDACMTAVGSPPHGHDAPVGDGGL